ncbi:MAG: alpha-L-fucosidase, partial [Anaerohalosphaera sp.]|nr:alpha-L-fucosidase [Anaerohalosphaera sp.]
WAQEAKNAGMKYFVVTTKHHDGFCMFDSKYTDYKITDKDCPFHTNKKANVTKEVFEAFRNKGLWAGAYFSKPDWNCDYYWDPYFPPLNRNVNYDPLEHPEKWNKYVEFTHNQILELMSDYGKVDILWLDGGWVAKESQDSIKEYWASKVSDTKSGFMKSSIVNQDIRMDQLVEKVRAKQPGIIVVDRAVEGKNQNYLTPENRVPEKELPFPWESCIIAGGGWSWTQNAKYKSSHELVHMLVDIVCKGGNLLLNIAPGPDGAWDDDAYQRLEDIGRWMDINGEAIYSTRAIPPYKEGNICYTNKKNTNTVYAIYTPDEGVSKMPATINIPAFTPADSSNVILLGFDKPLKWQAADKGTIVKIPKTLRTNPPCEYSWVIKFQKENKIGPAEIIKEYLKLPHPEEDMMGEARTVRMDVLRKLKDTPDKSVEAIGIALTKINDRLQRYELAGCLESFFLTERSAEVLCGLLDDEDVLVRCIAVSG